MVNALSCSGQHFDREVLRRDANALRTCGENLLNAPAQRLRVQSSDLAFERGGHDDGKLSGAIRDAGEEAGDGVELEPRRGLPEVEAGRFDLPEAHRFLAVDHASAEVAEGAEGGEGAAVGRSDPGGGDSA